MHFLVTRPKIQSETLQSELIKRGHSVTLAPLLEITYESPHLKLGSVQTIVVTSQNAIKALALHPNYEEILKFPLVVVGGGTASEARQAGFKILFEGESGAVQLAEDLKKFLDPLRGPLLYVSGDVLAVDLQSVLSAYGFTIRHSVVYKSTCVKKIPDEARDALIKETLDGVLLMSPRTSEVWIDLIHSSGLTEKTQKILHICLSDAVAVSLKQFNNIKIRVAAKPNLNELLKIIDELSSAQTT